MADTTTPTVLGKTSAAYSLGLVAPAGRLTFISGQVAMDASGDVIAPYDMEAQARHVFGSIRTLLEEAGGSLANVVKLTCFVTDFSRYPEYNKVRWETFSAPYPASTAVEVSALIKPELMLEIEAVAIIP